MHVGLDTINRNPDRKGGSRQKRATGAVQLPHRVDCRKTAADQVDAEVATTVVAAMHAIIAAC